MKTTNAPLNALRHHVTGAIERGEATAIVEVPAKSEYDIQAENFLTSHGLKFRATLSDSKTPSWAENEHACGHHYRVTISKEPLKMWEVLLQYPDDTRIHRIGQASTKTEAHNLLNKKLSSLQPEYAKKCIPNIVGKILRNPDRLTFDFFGSIADAEKGIVTVKPYDVLACISSDACTPDTFADFCAEYGYEADSIKSLQMFRRCDRFAKRLRAFFTESELSALSEIQ